MTVKRSEIDKVYLELDAWITRKRQEGWSYDVAHAATFVRNDLYLCGNNDSPPQWAIDSLAEHVEMLEKALADETRSITH